MSEMKEQAKRILESIKKEDREYEFKVKGGYKETTKAKNIMEH